MMVESLSKLLINPFVSHTVATHTFHYASTIENLMPNFPTQAKSWTSLTKKLLEWKVWNSIAAAPVVVVVLSSSQLHCSKISSNLIRQTKVNSQPLID